MKKVAIIGHFGEGKKFYDGQTIKTRIFAQEIEKKVGQENVIHIDTFGWKKHPILLLLNCAKSVFHSKNVVFLTDEGGIKIFPWLLLSLNAFCRRKLHYVVVGGWLVHFPQKHRFIAACIKRLDGVWVETNYMKKELEALNFRNINLLPNFKNLHPISEEQLVYIKKEPYLFCTFSRVMKEKGIEDAINAINEINNEYGRTVCKLDIYGVVDAEQRDWFQKLLEEFSDEIKYCGAVDYDKSVECIKDYYALLFPTCYQTEGVPGTIIDAYAAGVPVIASRWNSFDDVIDEGVTGFGYPCLHNENLKAVMIKAMQNPEEIGAMKKSCLQKSLQYLPSYSIQNFVREL